MIFTEIEPGYSVENNPINAYKSSTTGDKYFYLLAGVHGDEIEGVFVLNKLFYWLKESQSILEIPLIVIPILNVDGYRDQQRVNSHGVDLNRNLNTTNWTSEHKGKRYFPGSAPLSEPENQFLDSLFQEYPPGFVLSIHSWKPMMNYNGDAKAIAKFLSAYNQYPVSDDIGYPTPGSLGHYLVEKYNCPSVTFELPVLNEDKSLQDIWEETKVSFEKLFTSEIVKSPLS